MDRRRKSDPGPDLSLGQRAEVARIEAALFGRSSDSVEIGRYRIDDRIGSGAFATVYRAHDPRLDRTVAIKLLHTDNDTGAFDRLLEEARAMAMVQHPNVAAVYDADVAGEGEDAHVYLAMEFVDGDNLRDWGGRQPRGTAEILDAMLQAGRGLAAAHGAGIAHQDFKPDNVLVGSDGRVRVADFGLAQRLGTGSLPPGVGDLDKQQLVETGVGTVVGTPAYLAPEQFQGAPGDALSDQFSFCIALWEALYGERPFAGASCAELASEVCAGRLRAPGQRRVPARVRRALVRGLSVEPDRRFQSMDDLLRAIEPRGRAWLWAGAAAVLVIGAGAFFAYAAGSAGEREEPCATSGAPVAGVWNKERRQTLSALATEAGEQAERSWERASPLVDEYAATLGSAHVETCRATHVDRQQSAELLDLRMLCLRDRRRELDALLRLFEDGRPDLFEQSMTAVYRLTPPGSCGDIRALQELAPRPTDAAAVAEIGEIEDSLARARALYQSGRSPDAVESGRAALARAEAVGYAPLIASVAYWLSEAEIAVGQIPTGLTHARRAFDAALAGSDARTGVRAATLLAYAGAYDPSQRDESLRWVETGTSLLARLDDSPALAARLANAEGNAHLTAEAPGPAQAAFERAVARYRELDDNHPRLGSNLAMLGVAELQLGRLSAAEALLREALERIQRDLGERHAEVSSTLSNLAMVRAARGAYDEATDLYRDAMERQVKSLGADHPFVAMTGLQLAELLFRRGDLDAAGAELARADRIARSRFPPEHPLHTRIEQLRQKLQGRQ